MKWFTNKKFFFSATIGAIGAFVVILLLSSEANAQLPPPPPPAVIPAAPTGLAATPVSTSQINLSWNANTDMAILKYIVYRNGVNIAEVTSGTSYQDSSLQTSVTYSYEVSAVSDPWGFEGEKSIGVTASTQMPTYTITDFVLLVADWLKTMSSAADVNSDGVVNTRDLGIMMSHWSAT